MADGWMADGYGRWLMSISHSHQPSAISHVALFVTPLCRVHFLELELLLVEHRLAADAGELPRRDVREVPVVAQRLAVRGLALLSEVAAARFAALQRVEREQLRELEIVADAAGVFEALVQIIRRARHRHVLPELLAQLRNRLERAPQALLVPRHPDVVPHDAPELAVNLADAAAPFDREQAVDLALRAARRFPERLVIGRHLRERRARDVVADGVRDDEVAVGEPLHQRARA